MSLKQKQFRNLTDAVFFLGVAIVLFLGVLSPWVGIDMLFVFTMVIAFWTVVLVLIEVWASWPTLCSKWEKLVYFVKRIKIRKR
jgi:hypothetical protein